MQFFFTETGLAVQTAQKTGDSVVQFGMVVDMPVGVPTTGYGSVALCSDAGREKGRILRHFEIFYGDFLGPLMAQFLLCVVEGRWVALTPELNSQACQFVVHSGP